MGTTLQIYAHLPCKMIDNAGNEINDIMIHEFYDCFPFRSYNVDAIIDSEDKFSKYKEILKLECAEYDWEPIKYLNEFDEFIKSYKNWNIKFYLI